MILKIKSWCEGIIIAIIISIIVEMLVPEGNNKKYVKVVIGIYIMFIVLNPILELLNYEFDFSSLFEVKTQETYSNVNDDIRDVYLVGIKVTIIKDLEKLGYIVKNVDIYLDINYENIEKVNVELEKKSENIIVEPVIIGKKNQNNVSQKDSFGDVLEYFKENYSLDEDKIFFY